MNNTSDFEREIAIEKERYKNLERSPDFLYTTLTRDGGCAPTGSDPPTTSGGKYKQYPCPSCKYVTDRKNNLKRHLLTMHERCSKLLECCDYVFANKSELRQHVTERHAGAGYGCRVCGRRFSRKALMKRHSAVHSGHREHSCGLCDYATSHKSNLDRHVRRHQQHQRHLPVDSYFSPSVTSPCSNSSLQVTTAIPEDNHNRRVLAPFLGDLCCRDYDIDGTGVLGYGAVPLLSDYSLLRERAMLRLFGFPASFATIGWNRLIGGLTASRHRHGYRYGWDDAAVAMATEDKDAGNGCHSGDNMDSSESSDWPLNLKTFKTKENLRLSGRSHQLKKDPPSPGGNIPPGRNQGETTTTTTTMTSRDPDVTTGTDTTWDGTLSGVDPGRRVRLAPFIHTCAECAHTFPTQLDLKDHVEASHPFDSTGSQIKSITLQVKHARRVLTSGSVFSSDYVIE